MQNKRGQFYLIAAIIIVIVVAGFITVSNYSKKKTSVKIYDLGEELGIESQNVIDYGTYQEKDLDALLDEFTDSYAEYAKDNKNLYFLFGDATSIRVKAYQEIEEEVSVDGSPLPVDNGKGEGTYTPDNPVIISIEDVEYQFDLVEGENFYFIISQEIEGEKYVITG